MHFNDGTIKEFEYKYVTKDELNYIVRKCKREQVFVARLDIKGDCNLDRLNIFLAALDGIAGYVKVEERNKKLVVVYVQPKHLKENHYENMVRCSA